MHTQIITMNDHTLHHRAGLERRQGSGSAKGFRKGYGILQTDRFQSAGIRLLRIPEPKEDGETVSWEEAMMVMPGVAFDVNCNRVGYGGGFYDRFLENIRRSAALQ